MTKAFDNFQDIMKYLQDQHLKENRDKYIRQDIEFYQALYNCGLISYKTYMSYTTMLKEHLEK